jgi:hypothetical protein
MKLHRYMSPQDRFWSQVDKSGDCWVWTGLKNNGGYGRIRVNGKQTTSHRYSYELHYGSIPDGLLVCHDCPDGDNPACVNPAHLFLGTNLDNIRDRTQKGRTASGDANASRLYPEKRPRGENHWAYLQPHKKPVGERNGRAKITRLQAGQLKDLWATGKYTKVQLGKMFNITDVQAGKIIRSEAWKELS